MSNDIPVNIYGKRILWEIPVQLCMRDFLNEGDIAIDVGANIGGVAIALSRMVGKSGIVHAFEANPFLLSRIENDLKANKVNNVKVIPKAVWSVSGEIVSFYCEKSYYATGSSLLRRDENSTEVKIDTISLDDYCNNFKIVPNVIKIDVEGAEFQVLKGATETLKKFKPVVVLEYTSSDSNEDPLDYLSSLGYVLYDTNLYQRVNRAYYITNDSGHIPVNVLGIPDHRIFESPSYNSLVILPEQKLYFKEGIHHSGPILLGKRGRYLAIFEFDGPDTIVAGLLIKNINNEYLAYYEAPIRHLKHHSCSHMVIEIDEPTKIICEIVGKDLSNILLKKIEIFYLDFKESNRK